MSRLEKGEIGTIDAQELSSILLFIYQNEDEKKPSLDSILNSIFSTLELQFSDEEIEQQLWLLNFDTVARRIPIPEGLRSDIAVKMSDLGLTTAELCKRINANEGILPEIDQSEEYPYNEWQVYVENHKIVFTFIRMQVKEQEIDDILVGNVDSTSYVLLQSICYYIHKIERFGSQVQLSEEQNTSVYRETVDYLNQHQFYSMTEKNRLAKQARNQDERDRLISSFDKENQELVMDILANIRLFSELDIQRGNILLSSFVKNLQWDVAFTFSLAGMKFAELNNLSHSNRRKMLTEVKSLIEKYKNLPDQEKTINQYDNI